MAEKVVAEAPQAEAPKFLAVRMKAYPHDVASIFADDFDPMIHEIARESKDDDAPKFIGGRPKWARPVGGEE